METERAYYNYVFFGYTYGSGGTSLNANVIRQVSGTGWVGRGRVILLINVEIQLFSVLGCIVDFYNNPRRAQQKVIARVSRVTMSSLPGGREDKGARGGGNGARSMLEVATGW